MVAPLSKSEKMTKKWNPSLKKTGHLDDDYFVLKEINICYFFTTRNTIITLLFIYYF